MNFIVHWHCELNVFTILGKYVLSGNSTIKSRINSRIKLRINSTIKSWIY